MRETFLFLRVYKLCVYLRSDVVCILFDQEKETKKEEVLFFVAFCFEQIFKIQLADSCRDIFQVHISHS